jgi:hypothetical protein
MPGQVESYDAEKQTANVQPLIKNVVADPDGAQLVEDYPVIPSVPVVFPRGGGFFFAFPLQAGDFVLLAFCERSIDQYMRKGKLTHPVDLEKHGFSGAVAYAGLYPTDLALSDDGVATGIIIGKEGGPHLYIDGVLIEFGKKGSGETFPIDSKLQSELSGIKGALDAIYTALTTNDTHTHLGNLGIQTGPPVPPMAAGSNPYNPGATASERVKVDK